MTTARQSRHSLRSLELAKEMLLVSDAALGGFETAMNMLDKIPLPSVVSTQFMQLQSMQRAIIELNKIGYEHVAAYTGNKLDNKNPAKRTESVGC